VSLGQKIYEVIVRHGNYFEWHFDNNIYKSNPIFIQKNGNLKLIEINEHNCQDSINIEIQDECLGSLYVPNSFSPNGDFINDTFKPTFTGYSSLSLHIFNRWGQQIYLGNAGWNGTYQNKPCIQGTYVYQIELINNNDNSIRFETGTINLLR